MKKIGILLATFALFITLTATVFAQSTTFEKAYQDYQFTRSVYDQSYTDYQNARNAYAANQTLSLKEEARRKTLKMLKDRDQLMIVYVNMLKTKISELPALVGSDRDSVYSKIDAEVVWHTNHKANYKDDDDLEILFSKNDEAKDRYKTQTLLVIDESLFDISLGEVKGLRQEHEQLYATERAIIDAGVASGKLTLDPFNHWFTDIDSTVKTLKEAEDESRTKIQDIYNQTYAPEGAYDNALTILSRTLKPLSQFNQFLLEIAAYIRNNQ